MTTPKVGQTWRRKDEEHEPGRRVRIEAVGAEEVSVVNTANPSLPVTVGSGGTYLLRGFLRYWTLVTDAPTGPWRVGPEVGNLYRGDHYEGVIFNPETAALVVEAMNTDLGAIRREAAADALRSLADDIGTSWLGEKHADLAAFIRARADGLAGGGRG